MQPQFQKQPVNKMRKFIPSWKTIKLFLNIIYYVGFIFWFLTKMILLTFNENHHVDNNDIFIAMFFITFFILDVKDSLNYFKNKN
jgi:hypothetical protein